MKISKAKRFLSALLVACIIVSLLPTTAFAGDVDSYAACPVSIWEDSVDSVLCTDDQSGNGWSYDASKNELTLDGFNGKFIIIGGDVTIRLAKGSENTSTYGMYCEFGEVTICGKGTLNLGNGLAGFYTDLNIKECTINIQKKTLPSFMANILMFDEWTEDKIVCPIDISYTPDLQCGYYTGLFLDCGNLAMASGSLNITGTHYGIWTDASVSENGKVQGNTVGSGKIAITDTTEAAICVWVFTNKLEDFSAYGNGAITFEYAKAVGSQKNALTWAIEGIGYFSRNVYLYTSTKEIAKSAYINTEPSNNIGPSNGNCVYEDISFNYRPGFGSADKTYSGITFKDEWLLQDSYVYNHDLATMSLGLAMAGFESHSDTPDGNILALYEDLGFNPDSFVTAGYGAEDDGTVALAVATKTIYNEEGQAVPLVALTLRGGGYGNGGWAGNFAVDSSGAYHRGFADAAYYVRNFMSDYLSENGLDSDSVRIWLTGFSRSAATANLTSVFLSNARLAQRENIYTYTFATPNNQQIRYFQSKNNNIFNGVSSSRLLGKLWHKTKQSSSLLLDIYLPVPVYVRGKAFCEDIEELSEMEFTQASLINILYNDWLLFAKRTNNLMALYNLLTSLEPKKKAAKSTFYTQEGGTPQKRLHVQVKRRHLLRGEILLSDLEGKVPKHGYTIERVFELLYINFMEKHQNGGEVVQEILRLLED